MTKSKFYVTTPIYYVNDAPHIGHAYTTILADVLSRFHRALGDDTFFLTGLDEHGQKVQQAAEKRGLQPQAHCDDLAPRFTDLWKKLGISNDDFIRTTQERHKRIVQAILQKVYDSGDIYQKEYEGLYSVAEERFITEKEAESGQFREVKTIKEKNYFFKMSKYQERLIKYIEDNPGFIRPEHRKNEMLGFLRQPLTDLCISRPKARLSWGIEIPFDRDYVTYVWFDALINYISAIGYGSVELTGFDTSPPFRSAHQMAAPDEAMFKRFWPGVHLIGKDILTTHSIYWTTMLFSLELPLPECIFAHGWWLMGDSKMSKSLGNVVRPLDLIEQHGVDAVRYYLMAEMNLGMDANFTPENFIKRYNSDLANDFGNLLNRVSGLIGKNHGGVIPEAGVQTPAEDEVAAAGRALGPKVEALIREYKVDEAINEVMNLIRQVNKYMEAQAPWKLAKTDLPAAGRVLYTATEAMRLSAALLKPVMPEKAATVLSILGVSDSGLTWGELKSGVA
ncbi:MAG: methionine--tRNA ligase, partial [Candidatus Omnitrophica bacterium]|nr:methionine--tRNA ligase [Candidatus Omnitrophota bacterium]